MADPLKHPEIDYTRSTSSPLTTDTWVLVADGEKALLLRNDADAENPNLTVIGEEEQDNPPTHDQGTDKPGRFNDGPSVQRSAVDDTDWHWLAKERFASDLAELLYKKAHAGEFDRIILCAAPKILGELRNELHKEVQDKIVGEVDLVLTNHPVDEIAERVGDALTE